MEYLPTRYEASESEWNNRHTVWNFKDGDCSQAVLNNLAEVIRKECSMNPSGCAIYFIPASTSWKTINRYSFVARQLNAKTGMSASLSAISRRLDSEAGHLCGKTSNPTEEFIFDSSVFRGKKVILIDDVITRGRTFVQTANKLMQNGASSVVGLFVAKTVNPDWNSSAA
jgi:predicted amidophosphoribosyltransferase